ncbi:MAG TPA: RHS repeat-associated core domain-containing protein [Candidatus Binatia bacterium]|nr:RHS repeat-associated core domain-containing protein [Candidatus Binatia bacterium]
MLNPASPTAIHSGASSPKISQTKPTVLTNLMNGLGASTHLEYVTAMAASDGGAFPFPYWVVTELRHEDEVSNVVTFTKYGYAGAFYDGADREFRGFAAVRAVTGTPDDTLTTQINERADTPGSGRSTLTEYYQDDRRKGLVRRQWSFGAVSDTCAFEGNASTDVSSICSPYHYLLSLEENCWEENSGDCCWAYEDEASCLELHPPSEYGDSSIAPILLRETRTTPYRVGDDTNDPIAIDSMRKTIRYAHDDYGNITKRTVLAGAGPSAEVGETETTYDTSTWRVETGTLPSTYLVTRPLSVKTRDLRSGSRLSTQTFTYIGGTPGTAKAGRVATSTTCPKPSSTSCRGTAYSYDDAFGNLVSTTSPMGVVSTVVYDADMNQYPVKSIDAAGLVTFTYYESGTGQLIYSRNANGHIVQTRYDGFGRFVKSWTNSQPNFTSATPERLVRYVTPTLGGAAGGATPGRVESFEYVAWSGTGTAAAGTYAESPKYVFYDGSARILGVQALTKADGDEKVIAAKRQILDGLGNVVKEFLPAAVNALEDVWTPPVATAPGASFVYDEHGRLERKVLPDNSMVDYISTEPGVSVVLDANLTALLDGNPATGSADEPGSATIVISDALGRTISRETCSGEPQGPDFSHCSGASVNRTYYTYDALDRVRAVEQAIVPNESDSAANRQLLTETSYDGRGNVTSERHYDAGPATADYGEKLYKYDSDGRVRMIVGPNSSTRHYYDFFTGRLLKTTTKGEGSRNGVEYVYGAVLNDEHTLGRARGITTTSTSSGKRATVTKTFTYTRDGKLGSELSYISGDYKNSQLEVVYRYDVKGRVVEREYPALRSDGTFEYQVVRTEWNKYGQAVSLELQEAAGTSPLVDSISYDIYGNAVDVSYSNGVHDYATYDLPSANLRLLCRQTTTRATNPECGTAYDSSYDRQALLYVDYDTAGRIREVADLNDSPVPADSSNSFTVYYDAIGRVKEAQYVANDYDKYEYDDFGNIALHKHSHPALPNVEVEKTYFYESIPGSFRHPHRLTRIETVMPNAPTATATFEYQDDGARKKKGTQQYRYDGFGKLANVPDGNGGSLSASVYDESGKRVVHKDLDGTTHYFDGGMLALSSTKLVRHFSIAGRIVARDEAIANVNGGLLASSIASPTATASKRHPELARWAARAAADTAGVVALLLVVGAAAFSVSLVVVATPGGSRVAAATAGFIIFMVLPIGNVVPHRVAGLVGLGQAFGATLVTPSQYFHHSDHVGSTQVVTRGIGGAAGTIDERIRYRVFGQIRWADGEPPESRRTFSGHVYDSDAELLYMGARHYDAEVGTFLTFDPAFQYASPYTYAGNNPVGIVDPTGAEGITAAFLAAMAIIGYFTAGTQILSAALGGGDLGAALVGGAITVALAYVGAQGQMLSASKSLAGSFAVNALKASTYGLGAYGAVQSIRNGNIGAGIAGALAVAAGIYEMAQGMTEAGQDRRARQWAKENNVHAGGEWNDGAIPTVDDNFTAFYHYFKGGVPAADLGPETRSAIMNAPEVQDQLQHMRDGTAKYFAFGRRTIDLTYSGRFSFMGRTPVSWIAACSDSSCTARLTGGAGDGMWDIRGDADGPGPLNELPGGQVYPFRPFTWTVSFPQPASVPSF